MSYLGLGRHGVCEGSRKSKGEVLALPFICSMSLGHVFNFKGFQVLTCKNRRMVIDEGHQINFNSLHS